MEIITIAIKTKLLHIINKIIEKNAWTQAFAAEKLSIDQPKVSQIKNSKIDAFSLERLLGFLKNLDHDEIMNLEITITMTASQEIKSEAEKVKHEVESQ